MQVVCPTPPYTSRTSRPDFSSFSFSTPPASTAVTRSRECVCFSSGFRPYIYILHPSSRPCFISDRALSLAAVSAASLLLPLLLLPVPAPARRAYFFSFSTRLAVCLFVCVQKLRLCRDCNTNETTLVHTHSSTNTQIKTAVWCNMYLVPGICPQMCSGPGSYQYTAGVLLTQYVCIPVQHQRR